MSTTRFVTYRPNSDRSKPDLLDRYKDFLSWKRRGYIQGWSAAKNFEPGDVAIFYMAAPVSSIVAMGLVDSEPYYEEIDEPADFKNPVFCDYKPVWFLEKPVPIHQAIERQKLQQWWATRPYQGIRSIDPAVAEALKREMVQSNPTLADVIAAPRVIPPLNLPPSQDRSWKLEHILALTWYQFELLVRELFQFRSKKAQISLTPKKDYGVDIIITTWMSKEIVQCKRYVPSTKVLITGTDTGGNQSQFERNRAIADRNAVTSLVIFRISTFKRFGL